MTFALPKYKCIMMEFSEPRWASVEQWYGRLRRVLAPKADAAPPAPVSQPSNMVGLGLHLAQKRESV